MAESIVTKKIEDFTAAETAADADLMVIQDSTATKKITWAKLAELLKAKLGIASILESITTINNNMATKQDNLAKAATTETDFNNIKAPGNYWINPNTTTTNNPTGTYGILEVLRNGVMQEFTAYSTNVANNGRVFVRFYANSAWTAWVEQGRARNTAGTAVDLISKTSYTFPSDGYLYVQASYRQGYYVKCSLLDSAGTKIGEIGCMSAMSADATSQNSQLLFVWKGMQIDTITKNSASYNVLRFVPMT